MQNNIVKLQNHLSSFNPHLYCFVNFIIWFFPGSRNGHHIWNEHSVCCLYQERHFFVGTIMSTCSLFALQFYNSEVVRFDQASFQEIAQKARTRSKPS